MLPIYRRYWSAVQPSRQLEDHWRTWRRCSVWIKFGEDIKICPHPPSLKDMMSAALSRSTASASKAKSKPIPRPTEDSDSEESLPLVPASSSSSRYRSLTVARWPRVHSIKEPFQLTLGGKMQAPKRSRGRRSESPL